MINLSHKPSRIPQNVQSSKTWNWRENNSRCKQMINLSNKSSRILNTTITNTQTLWISKWSQLKPLSLEFTSIHNLRQHEHHYRHHHAVRSATLFLTTMSSRKWRDSGRICKTQTGIWCFQIKAYGEEVGFSG